MGVYRRLLAFVLACSASGACNPPNVAGPALAPETAGQAFGGAQCSVVRPKTEPDLMAWDPASRADLNTQRQEGLVVVHYEAKGCDVQLEVLSNCDAPGTYTYYPYPETNSIVAHNQAELYAALPLGAARLASKLQGSRALRTDYDLVGVDAIKVGTVVVPGDLKGQCDGATHVVSKIYVGGFALAAGESRSVDATATVFGVAGGGAKEGADVEHLQQAGDPDACKKAMMDGKESVFCDAPLRIALLPLGAPAAPSCPSGSTWDGTLCMRTQVVTQVQCPGAMNWNGSQCVGAASPANLAPAPQPAPSGRGCPAGMASLPGGSFTMGDRNDSVTVQPFCMDVTEVTVDAYEVCVRAGQCSADHPGQWTPDGNTFTAATACNYGVSGRGNHPVNCVDWGQSATYCHAQGKRLPSEEEWEWAARGESQGRSYPWGNAAPNFQLCWSGIQKRSGTCPVGSFPEGDAPGGIHDLAGNVLEWTSSNFDATGAARVNRGGSWYNVVASYFRAAYRDWYSPSYRFYLLGFRCAR